jgi:histidine triad (HIT) family protein
MNNNCIFCKIIGKEIPSSVVYEDDFFVAIMDISPANKGHVILLTKKHMANLFEMDELVATKIMPVVSRIGLAMKEELQCEGLNILQNNGEVAGQTVEHYHIHLIPRFKDDLVHITWDHKTYKEGEVKEIAEAIKKKITG